MNRSHCFPTTIRLWIAFILISAYLGDSQAQAQPANPQAPVLKPAVPLGMQRGTTLDLTLTGNNLAEPTGLWTSFPAKATIPTSGNNGKENGKLLVRLDVPKDAPLGFHSIRLATRRGMSNLLLFCIDDLPQMIESATNHTPSTAQTVPVPCVVAGKADAETADYFKFRVTEGQRLSFEVLGRRLGSQFDPQVQILDANGRELPSAYSNDAPGLQTDPRLTYTFKTAGEYLVAVRDVSYRGGEFYYRLRIGDFPCATTTLPLAVKRGTKMAVRFAGPNVDGVAPLEVTAPTDPALDFLSLAPRGANGLHGWPVYLALSDIEETLEDEPNDTAAKANRILVPGAITARFEKKGDIDNFNFALKKGVRYILSAQTHELGSPTEVYMTLRDAKGGQLRASDPMKATAQLDFTPPADGDYTLQGEHLHLWGGPDEVYRVSVAPFEPGFDLTVALDRFNVEQGGKLSIPILAPRRDFGGPIEISAIGPKGISGTLAVPAGKAPPPNQPLGTLVVNVAPDVPIGPYVFQIQGKASINGKTVIKLASVRAVVSQGLANLPLPPKNYLTSIGLAVTEKPPFTLAAKLDAASYAPGKPATLTVTAARLPGFSGEIALSTSALPSGVTAMLKNIPANQNEIKLTLTLTPQAKFDKATFTVTGKAKHQDREATATAPPVTLVIKK